LIFVAPENVFLLFFSDAATIEPMQKPQSAIESRTIGFGGFNMSSGSVPKTKTVAPRKDIFAGIDEEVQSLFGAAPPDLLPLGEAADEVFQGFQPVSKVFGADAIARLKKEGEWMNDESFHVNLINRCHYGSGISKLIFFTGFCVQFLEEILYYVYL
jgi:hypothetical protein